MSDSRLRRLDQLFAERVLGIKPHKQIPCPDYKPGDTMSCAVYHYEGHHLGWICPHYTRSLDAAWEGLLAASERHVDTFSCGWRVDECWGKPHRDCMALIGAGAPSWAFHPAEALVLACLRAVGCSEEELA